MPETGGRALQASRLNCYFLNFLGQKSVLEETKHLYSNVIKIILGYQVLNLLIDQPSYALISDPSSEHSEHATIP